MPTKPFLASSRSGRYIVSMWRHTPCIPTFATPEYVMGSEVIFSALLPFLVLASFVLVERVTAVLRRSRKLWSWSFHTWTSEDTTCLDKHRESLVPISITHDSWHVVQKFDAFPQIQIGCTADRHYSSNLLHFQNESFFPAHWLVKSLRRLNVEYDLPTHCLSSIWDHLYQESRRSLQPVLQHFKFPCANSLLLCTASKYKITWWTCHHFDLNFELCLK